MPKIIIEEEGRPSVTLLIDPAEPPVSLGALLERARKFREEAAAKNVVTARPFDQLVANVAHLQTVLERLRTSGPGPFVSIYDDERPAVIAALERAIAPQLLVKPDAISEETMAEMLKAGPGPLTFVPDPESGQNTRPISFEVMGGGHIIRAIDSDLEDVLDSYRLAGKPCGLQVFAVDHVVCWIGDIEEVGARDRHFPIRMKPVPNLPLFYETRGANALEDAAKWLREQLNPAQVDSDGPIRGCFTGYDAKLRESRGD